MFSKALFKQSCKANGTMWSIITFAVCFMLACVMLISGNGNIGEVKNSIQDTIITKEIDAQMEKRSIFYYSTGESGLAEFDALFSVNAQDTISYLIWYSQMPNGEEIGDADIYAAAVENWKKAQPELTTAAGQAYVTVIDDWITQMPLLENFSDTDNYLSAVQSWRDNSPATQENAITAAYTSACEELQEYLVQKALNDGYAEGSTESSEISGIVMYTLNPNGMFNDFYTQSGEEVPAYYDFMSLIAHINDGDIDTYLTSEERSDYRERRAEECAAIFLAGNMTKPEAVETLMNALSDYGVTKEKYESFDYTYNSIKHMASTAIVTYRGRLEYEIDLLCEQYEAGEFENEDAYLSAVTDKKEYLTENISASFLSTLPREVSDALEEIGQMDLYSLIVGSIFYKLAGLLLPIIYMIMASNNLIAGQVDSGSMAYVLSTSTKRITVVFTQATYLISSLFAMFSLTTATGCVCLSLVAEDIKLTYESLILLNVGAFLVLLALSGLCFFTSCVFNRSKRSMAIGGGLSIFALVAAMLGLFGSPVIPSVVRLEALNNFNYATVISLFDVISIIDGTDAFILKFIILGVAGLLGYILGSVYFTKKDLPL